MRVVCDNCGAVYKIADSKLTKEVNRATCKRCGHKIIIYKPGSQAAQKAAATGASEDDERTVIKSVPELQKMVSKQGVPSIGSLTAELRAISIPGIQSVGGPTPAPPQSLGPAGPMAGDTRAPSPPTPIAPPPPAQPVVIPQTTIPPSDSPKTKVYDGPSPQLSPLSGKTPPPGPTPPLVTSGADATRPMPMPGGPVPQPGAPVPQPGGPVRQPGGPVPSNGSPGPAAVKPAGPAPSRTPPVSTIGSPSTAVSPVAETGSSVLGGVAVFSMVGIVGLLASVWVTAVPASSIAHLLAALGLFGCFFLSLLTGRGRKPERSLIALLLAIMVALGLAGMHFVAFGGVEMVTGNTGQVEPPEVFQPVKGQPTPLVDPMAEATGGQLDSAEQEELERYSEREPVTEAVAPESTPVKESKRDVVTRPTPTPRPTATPRAERTPAPTPARTPTPGPRQADVAPPSTGNSGDTKAEGPSPFVIDTIIRNNATIVRCLRVEESRGVDLSGKIYLKFTVAPDGSVSKARITTSRFAGTSLDSCISSELNSLTFPPYDGTPKKITYPLIVQ